MSELKRMKLMYVDHIKNRAISLFEQADLSNIVYADNCNKNRVKQSFLNIFASNLAFFHQQANEYLEEIFGMDLISSVSELQQQAFENVWNHYEPMIDRILEGCLEGRKTKRTTLKSKSKKRVVSKKSKRKSREKLVKKARSVVGMYEKDDELVKLRKEVNRLERARSAYISSPEARNRAISRATSRVVNDVNISGLFNVRKPRVVKKSPKKSVRKSPKKAVKKSPKKAAKKSPKKAVKKSPKKSVRKSPKKAVKKSPKKAVRK